MLILGETGAGKSMLAGHIHALSGRTGRFNEKSAPQLSDSLLHAELAGYAKGAFTGAYHDTPGLLEASHLGTLFLDEIGTASPRFQEYLLDVLDGRPVQRVGESRPRPVDVRILAATNANLDERVVQQTFRGDLLARFGPFVLPLPPLRERRDEILPLAERFVADFCAGRRRPPVLERDAAEVLVGARWPGNIRDLKLACGWALQHVGAGDTIALDHLPVYFIAPQGRDVREAYDRAAARRAHSALAAAGGNKSEAARSLGVSRPTFYRQLRRERAAAN
jgi:DNA-binding NtrC family response regulator